MQKNFSDALRSFLHSKATVSCSIYLEVEEADLIALEHRLKAKPTP